MAGVAGLTSSNEINGCDTKYAKIDPAKPARNPKDCRTMTDYQQTKSDLRAIRTKYGANGPIGHACSNLDEMLENLAKATDRDVKKRLAANIQRQNKRLAELLAAARTA